MDRYKKASGYEESKSNYMKNQIFSYLQKGDFRFQMIEKNAFFVFKVKIFIIKFQAYLLFIYLIENVFFVLRCLAQTVQDDISYKTVPI